MTPATMPSRRTERSVPVMERPGAILAPVHRTSNPTSGVAGETDAVIGVAATRWQRGAACAGAPRVSVTPGAATADAPRASRRSSRILVGRALVIIVGEPVGAPLVAHAREIRQPERVGWRGADDGQAADRRGRGLVAPRESGALDASASRPFPLGLRRQPRRCPRGEADGLAPGKADDRLVRAIEARLAPERRRCRPGPGAVPGAVAVRDRGCGG